MSKGLIEVILLLSGVIVVAAAWLFLKRPLALLAWGTRRSLIATGLKKQVVQTPAGAVEQHQYRPRATHEDRLGASGGLHHMLLQASGDERAPRAPGEQRQGPLEEEPDRRTNGNPRQQQDHLDQTL